MKRIMVDHAEQIDMERAKLWATRKGLGRLKPLPKKLIWITTPR